MTQFYNMADILEDRRNGRFTLERFTITKENNSIRFPLPHGEYVRLMEHGEVVMSDTPMEKRTNQFFIDNAHGDVLIAGLGIGLIVLPIQDKEEVTSITILEKNPEVIEMVAEQLPLNDKVTIIQGDVYEHTFPKGTKFNCIYFDIWNYVNSEVYQEMKKLKRKYLKYKRTLAEDPNAFIKCWAEYQAKNNKRLY